MLNSSKKKKIRVVNDELLSGTRPKFPAKGSVWIPWNTNQEEYKLSDPINKASYCLCLMSKNYETSTGEAAVRCSEILLLTSVGKVNTNHESEYHHCAYNNENHMTQSVLQGDLNLMKDLKGSGQSPEVHWHKLTIAKKLHMACKGCSYPHTPAHVTSQSTTVEAMPKTSAQLSKPKANLQNVTQDPCFNTTTDLKTKTHQWKIAWKEIMKKKC